VCFTHLTRLLALIGGSNFLLALLPLRTVFNMLRECQLPPVMCSCKSRTVVKLVLRGKQGKSTEELLTKYDFLLPPWQDKRGQGFRPRVQLCSASMIMIVRLNGACQIASAPLSLSLPRQTMSCSPWAYARKRLELILA